MKSPRLALLVLAVAAPLLAVAPAQAGTPPDYTVTADAGDAPPAVDIIKIRVRPTANSYQGTVFFTDLRAQKPNRWLISFDEPSSNRSARGNPLKSGNLVEVRINPAGKMSIKAFNVYADNSTRASTCSGVTATPSWNLDKIKFVVPRACWNVNTSYAVVTAIARHYTPDETWSTDLDGVAEGTKVDFRQFDWSFS